MIKFIYLAFILFLSTHFLACSGNECSATSDFIDDIDSDCVDDATDNCVGTYNPDQFDGDSDEIGYACDADDTTDGSLNALFVIKPEFNVAGYYEFEEVCGNFSSLKLEQTFTSITASDEFENIFTGNVTLNEDNSKISGTLTHESESCLFEFNPLTNGMQMNCECEFYGEKLFTHLRTE